MITDSDVPFHEWTPCEVHGHLWDENVCIDCGEHRED